MKFCSTAVKVAVAASGMIIGSTASASVAWHGTLSTPHFMANGVVLIYSSGSRANVPSCGASQPARFAFDSTTPAGKSQLAGILTAFASGKQVVVVGNDTCSAYPDSETVNYFYIAE
jgi:hypothetical protein